MHVCYTIHITMLSDLRHTGIVSQSVPLGCGTDTMFVAMADTVDDMPTCSVASVPRVPAITCSSRAKSRGIETLESYCFHK